MDSLKVIIVNRLQDVILQAGRFSGERFVIFVESRYTHAIVIKIYRQDAISNRQTVPISDAERR